MHSTTSVEELIGGLPSPDGLPPRPPFFSCSESLAPSKNATGATTDVTPHGGWPGGFPGDPNWGIAVVTVPWEVYKRSGRTSIVKKLYAAARMFVDFLDRNGAYISTAPLYTLGVYGDWLCCDVNPKCGDESGPPSSCNNHCPHPPAFGFAHILATSRLVDLANISGHIEDVKYYSSRLPILKAAYHKTFFHPDLGWYADAALVGRQSSPKIQSHQVFPLYLGVVPKEHETSVVNALLASIRNASNHINCGIVGSRFILEVLARYGHADIALALSTQQTCPSWGYMVENVPGDPASHDIPGTIWEAWPDAHGTGVSKNHPALTGGIGTWLFQLAGLAEESNMNSLVFRPMQKVLHTLGSAEFSVQTPQGKVGFSWRFIQGAGPQEADGLEANISLPLQLPTTSLLHLPISVNEDERWM